jgi:hypothetical protein
MDSPLAFLAGFLGLMSGVAFVLSKALFWHKLKPRLKPAEHWTGNLAYKRSIEISDLEIRGDGDIRNWISIYRQIDLLTMVSTIGFVLACCALLLFGHD